MSNKSFSKSQEMDAQIAARGIEAVGDAYGDARTVEEVRHKGPRHQDETYLIVATTVIVPLSSSLTGARLRLNASSRCKGDYVIARACRFKVVGFEEKWISMGMGRMVWWWARPTP